MAARRIDGMSVVAAAMRAGHAARDEAKGDTLVAAAGCLVAALDLWADLGAPQELLTTMLEQYATLNSRELMRPEAKA